MKAYVQLDLSEYVAKAGTAFEQSPNDFCVYDNKQQNNNGSITKTILLISQQFRFCDYATEVSISIMEIIMIHYLLDYIKNMKVVLLVNTYPFLTDIVNKLN